jgi:hypothetical protein
LALSVPLSRFTSRVGGGSAFFVRHHYDMNTSPDLQKRIRRMVIAVRIFGWFFVTLASGFILIAVFIFLFDPQFPVTINGVKRTDMTAKLFIALFPLIHLALGLFLVFMPKSWVGTLIILQTEQMRRFISFFKKPQI